MRTPETDEMARELARCETRSMEAESELGAEYWTGKANGIRYALDVLGAS